MLSVLPNYIKYKRRKFSGLNFHNSISKHKKIAVKAI